MDILLHTVLPAPLTAVRAPAVVAQTVEFKLAGAAEGSVMHSTLHLIVKIWPTNVVSATNAVRSSSRAEEYGGVRWGSTNGRGCRLAPCTAVATVVAAVALADTGARAEAAARV